MKKYCLLLNALLLSTILLAQSDSIVFAHAQWTSKKLNKEVYWKWTHFSRHELFNANENITMIIVPAHASSVRLVVGYSDSLEATSQQAMRYGALAGINGSFFKMRGADPDNRSERNGISRLEPSKLDYNRAVTYLRKDNRLIAPNKVLVKQTVRGREQQGCVALGDTTVAILRADTLNFDWENTIAFNDVMTSGPLLILDGKNTPVPEDDFSRKRHPRTAVGKMPDGSIALLVVDGRSQESAGVNLVELQQIMRWVGCISALNLDGGGSSTMYIKGEPANGVVNYPSDNQKYDHDGERKVANTILIVPAD